MSCADSASFAAPLTPTIRKYLQLGNVQAQSGTTSTTNSRINPPIKAIPSQPTKSRSDVDPGLDHSVKLSINPKPSTLRSGPPLRSIQVATKRGEAPALGGSSQGKPPAVATRPFRPTVNATGPQRVIKQSAPASEGQVHPSDGKSAKLVSHGGAAPARSEKPSHTRTTVSTASLAHPSTSRPVNLTRQPPLSKQPPTKGNMMLGPGRATSGQRDLTRPTLSQMARVKPPVVRPLPKPVQGLDIRKAKPSAGSDSTVSTSRLPKSSRTQEGVTTGSIRGMRPITPASVPLPASPEPPSTREPGFKPGNGDPPSEKDGSIIRPEAVPGEASNTPSSQRVNSNEGFGESTVGSSCRSASLLNSNAVTTPATLDGQVFNTNLSCKTPISALLSSIQQGFDLTPCSPLSPPQHYISSSDSPDESRPFRLGVIARQDASAVTTLP